MRNDTWHWREIGLMNIRPTQAIIDLEAIRHNIRFIKSLLAPETWLIAVVKADAYGHGAIPISRAALSAGADSLAVAIPEEGIELREAGITAPIHVMGLVLPGQHEYFLRYDLIASVSSLESLHSLDAIAHDARKKIRVMVKIDTGMGRIGVDPKETLAFAVADRFFANIDVCGYYTHFASADKADKAFAKAQLAKFQSIQAELRNEGFHPKILSAANSAAIIDLPEAHFQAVRAGIILYGLPPSGEMRNPMDLHPVMTLRTQIVYIKDVPAGTPVSYGSTYITPTATRLATLPIGYADGYSRHLSSKAHVLVGGKRCPVVGRVCMDQTIIDIGAVPGKSGTVPKVKVGDEVILFGRQGKKEITVTELANLAGTINYELVCAVSRRVPRVYINE